MLRSKHEGLALAEAPTRTCVAVSRLAAWVLLPLSAIGARGAVAADYCVGTAAELNAALTAAASASRALFTTTIRLKQGTYDVGGSRMTQFRQGYFHALKLLGGHNSDCSARTVNPDNTIFDGGGATYFTFEARAELLIEGIRFRNLANTCVVKIESAGRAITVIATDGDGNSSETSVPVIYAPSGDTVFADGFENWNWSGAGVGGSTGLSSARRKAHRERFPMSVGWADKPSASSIAGLLG